MARIRLVLLAALVLPALPSFALEPGQALRLNYVGQNFTDERAVDYPYGIPTPYIGPARGFQPMTATFYLTADTRDSGIIDLSASNPALVRATYNHSGGNGAFQWERERDLGSPQFDIRGQLVLDADAEVSSWEFLGWTNRNDELFRAYSLLQPDGAARDEFEVDWIFESLLWNTGSPGSWTLEIVAAPFLLPAIPEPPAWALLAAGLPLLALRRRQPGMCPRRNG